MIAEIMPVTRTVQLSEGQEQELIKAINPREFLATNFEEGSSSLFCDYSTLTVTIDNQSNPASWPPKAEQTLGLLIGIQSMLLSIGNTTTVT